MEIDTDMIPRLSATMKSQINLVSVSEPSQIQIVYCKDQLSEGPGKVQRQTMEIFSDHYIKQTFYHQ